MTKDQEKFLALLTGRALRVMAEKTLVTSVRINFAGAEAEWWFRRACWLEYEAKLVENGIVCYHQYWAGIFERDCGNVYSGAGSYGERYMAKLGDGIFHGL